MKYFLVGIIEFFLYGTMKYFLDRANAPHTTMQDPQREEIRIRWEIKEREAPTAREADRERKRERTRRAKKARSDAMRKRKYPRCTQ
jgi:hypothetical protein